MSYSPRFIVNTGNFFLKDRKVRLIELPAFRLIKQSTSMQRKKASRDLLITLIFTFIPQLIGLLIVVLSEHRLNYFALITRQLIADGGLLSYSVALIAPVYISFLRDEALKDRLWVLGFALCTTFVSAITISLLIIGFDMRLFALTVISTMAISASSALLYLVNVVTLINPEDAAREINAVGTNDINQIEDALKVSAE